MKIAATLFAAMLSVRVFAAGDAPQGESEALKQKRIEEAVATRRMMHEYALEHSGRAFSPTPQSDSWFKEALDLTLVDEPIGTCAQTFATLARKEVFVSSRVMKKKLSIAASRTNGEKALEIFRTAIEAQGVAIVPIGKSILVLVDASEVAHETKG